MNPARIGALAALAFLPLAFLPLGCGDPAPGPSGGTSARDERVLTTFYPTTYFAQRIAGDAVEVHCLLPPDEDPIFWRPDDETILAYQRSALVVVNGAGFEKWVETTTLPEDRLVDTCAGVEDQLLRYENAVTHSHGPGQTHKHEGIDGHTWLDPVLATVQARAIHDALAARWPEHAKTFRANFEGLEKDLGELETAWKAVPVPDTLHASHPAYNYLGRRCGWKLRNFDLDPDTVPADPPDLPEGAVLMWESEPSDEVKRAIPARHVTVSPCETPPEEGDYLEAMRANIQSLAETTAAER